MSYKIATEKMPTSMKMYASGPVGKDNLKIATNQYNYEASTNKSKSG